MGCRPHYRKQGNEADLRNKPLESKNMKNENTSKTSKTSEAAANAERLQAMKEAKAAAAAAAGIKAAEVASKAAAAAADKAAADKAAAEAIKAAAADKAAAEKAAAAEADQIAAATGEALSREFDAVNGGVSRMAKQIQTIISACNGNISRAAAIVGRERRRLVDLKVEMALLELLEGDAVKVEAEARKAAALPIAAFVIAAKAAGLTRKSCQDFANGTDLVSRQSVSRAVIAAFADDDKPQTQAAPKTAAERILAILAKDDSSFTEAEAEAITAALARKIAAEAEAE